MHSDRDYSVSITPTGSRELVELVNASRPNPSGTGLGLTLCREIIEAHGGRLTLANRCGGGALVSIHLP